MIRSVAGSLALAATLASTGCGNTALEPVEVRQVVVTPSIVTLSEGDSFGLTFRALDPAGNSLPGRLVTWVALDPGVASVSGTGMVRARSQGRTVVEARVEGRIGSALVEVAADRTPRLLALEPDGAMEGDGDRQLLLMGDRFREGAVVLWNGLGLTATVASPQRATVPLGAAAFASAGVATVAVANPDGASSNVLTFPVARAPVRDVVIEPGALELVVGQTVDLVARVLGPDDRVLLGRLVLWSSGSSETVAVDGAGRVTARAPGATWIRAVVEGVADDIVVRIEESVEPVGFLIVRPALATTVVDAPVRYEARVLSRAGVELPGRSIDWSVEDADVATIDENGRASGLKRGTTRVLAVSGGVEGWATLEVRELPDDGLYPYELRHEWPYKPIVGDTVWTVPGVGEQPAALALESASLEVDLTNGRYRQRFVLSVIAGSAVVGEVEDVDDGRWGYGWDGSYWFTSSTIVGRTFVAYPGGPATLLVRQTVRALPEAHYTYVLR